MFSNIRYQSGRSVWIECLVASDCLFVCLYVLSVWLSNDL